MLLDARNLSKQYPTPQGPLPILTSVSLHMERGEAVSIMGPSGMGKSTLLYALGVLDQPTSGTITLDGVNPYALKKKEQATFRNQKIGFLFQDQRPIPETVRSSQGECGHRIWLQIPEPLQSW